MNKPQMFLAGVVLGQVLSLTIIHFSARIQKYADRLRQSILLYRVKRAYKRINRASDAASRLLQSF